MKNEYLRKISFLLAKGMWLCGIIVNFPKTYI